MNTYTQHIPINSQNNTFCSKNRLKNDVSLFYRHIFRIEYNFTVLIYDKQIKNCKIRPTYIPLELTYFARFAIFRPDSNNPRLRKKCHKTAVCHTCQLLGRIWKCNCKLNTFLVCWEVESKNATQLFENDRIKMYFS